MVVGCLVLIERIRGEVQHAVVERLVGEDNLVGLGLGLCLFALVLGHEHRVVQVALVHHPEVDETECQQQAGQGNSLQFACHEEHQADGADKDNNERAHGVAGEHGTAHLRQIGQQRVELVSRELRQGLHLARRDVVAKEHVGHRPEQQGHTAREGERGDNGLTQLISFHFPAHHFLQRQHGQQGNGELCDDENRGHGSELGVHRHVVDEEIGKTHEVLTPRQHDAQHRCRQECPLHRTFDDEQAQHEEEEHEGTDVDGPRRARLLAPVLAYLLVDADVVVVGVLHRRLVHHQRLRGTALDVGYEERPGLADAIRPLGDIVALQSARGLVGVILFH